jgi:hypothetical protein
VGEKVAAQAKKKKGINAMGTRCADHTTTIYQKKLLLSSLTSGGR